MSSSVTGKRTRASAIAISQEDGKLKAVELARHDGVLELLWTKSSEAGDEKWGPFAAECGLSADAKGRSKTGKGKTAVVGYGSAGVAFYRMDVPAVAEEEAAAVVQMQAETLLPLPTDQMELAWRSSPAQNGEMTVTLAAARREPLQGFVRHVAGFRPAKILLDCEGVVKAWRVLFGGSEKEAVIVNLGARDSQVCLAGNGRLSHAAVLDMGMEDFRHVRWESSGVDDRGVLEQTEATERFSQDMRSVLGSFDFDEPAAVPVYVLSDGSGAIEGVVACLVEAGIDAKAALPQIAQFGARAEIEAGEIYDYRVPMGLSLMALEAPAEELGLFEGIYAPDRKEKKGPALYSPITAGAIAVAMLVVLLAVSYVIDVTMEKRFSQLEARAGFEQLQRRQDLVRTVARQRPDMLQLLNEINSGSADGIMLDSLHFKKGQLVTLRGQAQRAEQLYEFQKALLDGKGITDVKLLNPTVDSKSKKVKFGMTFHYRNFTKKSATL
ncbi:MAG: hypothetical protein JSU70_13215 [Phycisphaerales bacterium]|nr:MAG: hypothetical protein JSU70_13215 [Phycisphaerales bacterium]